MSRPGKPANPFSYFRSLPKWIRLLAMICAQFPLSLRNVKDLLLDRGIDISHESVLRHAVVFAPIAVGAVIANAKSSLRA